MQDSGPVIVCRPDFVKLARPLQAWVGRDFQLLDQGEQIRPGDQVWNGTHWNTFDLGLLPEGGWVGWTRRRIHSVEPQVVFCGVRSGGYDTETDEPMTWDLECRFSDDQKFAAVSIDIEFPDLAERLAEFLNGWICFQNNPPETDDAYLFWDADDSVLPYAARYTAGTVESAGTVVHPRYWQRLPVNIAPRR